MTGKAKRMSNNTEEGTERGRRSEHEETRLLTTVRPAAIAAQPTQARAAPRLYPEGGRRSDIVGTI